MQIIDAAELVAGDVYAFVICCNEYTDLYEQRCLAVVTDTERLLRKRGRWHGQAGCDDDEYTLDDLLDAKSAIDATMDTQTTMKNAKTADDDVIPFTVHLDGWVPSESKKSESMIVDWDDDNNCFEDYPFDKGAIKGGHFIVVPVAAWLSDPRVHVLDWVNPDDMVKPLMRIATLGSETASSKRTDDNLRRIFG